MAIRTNYELIDFITNNSDFSINAKNLSGATETVITSANAVQYMLHKYGTRQYSVLRGTQATESEAFNDFSLDFRLWVMNRQHNIDRMYQALFDYDYSPIENYDRTENETINKDIDTTYGKKDTESGRTTLSNQENITDSDVTTKSGNTTNETERAGFNEPNTYNNDSKNTETFNNVKDSRAQTKQTTDSGYTDHGKVLTASGTDVVSDDTLRTLRVHGNIGVLQNVDMIEAELRLRIQSLAEMLLDNFINDYTFYA